MVVRGPVKSPFFQCHGALNSSQMNGYKSRTLALSRKLLDYETWEWKFTFYGAVSQ